MTSRAFGLGGGVQISGMCGVQIIPSPHSSKQGVPGRGQSLGQSDLLVASDAGENDPRARALGEATVTLVAAAVCVRVLCLQVTLAVILATQCSVAVAWFGTYAVTALSPRYLPNAFTSSVRN